MKTSFNEFFEFSLFSYSEKRRSNLELFFAEAWVCVRASKSKNGAQVAPSF